MLTVTPICPHALTNRSVVINATETAELRLAACSSSGAVEVDGMRLAEATPDSVLRVSVSNDFVPIAFLPEINDYDVLGDKLGWLGMACTGNCVRKTPESRRARAPHPER